MNKIVCDILKFRSVACQMHVDTKRKLGNNNLEK